jgi:hypothetical protein
MRERVVQEVVQFGCTNNISLKILFLSEVEKNVHKTNFV